MRTRLGCWVWPGSGRPRATTEPRGAADRPRPGSDPGQGRLVSTREATGPGRRAGRPGGVRVLEGAPEVGRRGFLQAAAVQGASLPVACVLLGRDARAAAAEEAGPAARPRRKGALRLPPGEAPAATIVRDFADPYLELLRLLREAAEIEHSLLVQYLYGAFSLKPAYEAVAGRGDPNARDLLGVAIQEMQHLRTVNQLLVALGAAPHLDRQDFPYEPDIYPFALNLEPLGRASLAKYVYTEAPGDALHFRAARTEDDFISWRTSTRSWATASGRTTSAACTGPSSRSWPSSAGRRPPPRCRTSSAGRGSSSGSRARARLTTSASSATCSRAGTRASGPCRGSGALTPTTRPTRPTGCR